MVEFYKLRYQKKRVGPRWLRKCYYLPLSDQHAPPTAWPCGGRGQQWRTSFYSRNYISLRKRTNNHKLSWPDRKEKLEKFVAGIQSLVLKSLTVADLCE